MEYQLAINVTPQIKLVQPELYMAEALYNTIKSNYQHLVTFLDFIQEDMTIEDEQQYLTMMLNHQAQNKGRLYLIYFEDELIGTIDLHKIQMQHKRRKLVIDCGKLRRSSNNDAMCSTFVLSCL